MSTYLKYLDAYLSFPHSFKHHLYFTNKKGELSVNKFFFKCIIEVSKKSSTSSFLQWHFLSAEQTFTKGLFTLATSLGQYDFFLLYSSLTEIFRLVQIEMRACKQQKTQKHKGQQNELYLFSGHHSQQLAAYHIHYSFSYQPTSKL